MGLLDDLKRQAEALQASKQTDSAARERNTALVEAACKSAFQYWLDLAKQLNVLRPSSPQRYVLDSRHVFEQLQMTDFRVDARRKSLQGSQLHEYLQLVCLLKSGRKLELAKDMPADVERIQSRLRQSGIEFHMENVREPDSGRYLHTRFEFTADFMAGVKLLPQHDTGLVQFQIFNIEGFETLLAETPAFEVNQVLLDELTKLLLGQPNRFLQETRLLRRG